MYKINYDSITGQVGSIQNDNMSIPIEPMNTDFQDFLKWNKTGKLDYKTPIEPQPQEPAETLEEKITRIVKTEIAKEIVK